MKNKGKFIVISGPSGVGKGTICNLLLQRNKDIDYSISVTTRKKRDNEINGKDYYFTSKENFEKQISNNEFIEYNIYNNEYYGTLKSEILKKINNKVNIITELDVNGAKNIKKLFKDSLLIYIKAPSFEELRKRLIKRGTEGKEEIEQRLKIAITEEKEKNKFDFIIMNDKLDDAILEIENIIKNI